MLAGLFLSRMDHCNFWLKKALDGKTLILYGARIHVLTRDRYERRVTEAKGQGPRLRLVLSQSRPGNSALREIGCCASLCPDFVSGAG
jgi:hypothetical protein